MDDVTTIVTVLVIAIGGLVGVAYLLDLRRKASGVVGPQLPELGSIGRALLWVIRGLVVVMVLSIIGVVALGIVWLLWVAVGCLALYLVIARIFQIVRLSGK